MTTFVVVVSSVLVACAIRCRQVPRIDIESESLTEFQKRLNYFVVLYVWGKLCRRINEDHQVRKPPRQQTPPPRQATPPPVPQLHRSTRLRRAPNSPKL